MSLGIIRGAWEVWGKSGCRGGEYVCCGLCASVWLFSRLWYESQDCGAGLRVPGLVSGLGGTSLCHAVQLDVTQ